MSSLTGPDPDSLQCKIRVRRETAPLAMILQGYFRILNFFDIAEAIELVSEVEAVPTMNPSALTGVRFLVTKRIEELDSSASALDDELAAVATRLQELRTEQSAAEARWGTLLSVLPAGDVDEIALEHAKRNPGSTTGIDGVAASLQDVKTGGGRKIMARRDRMLCHGDGRPMRR